MYLQPAQGRCASPWISNTSHLAPFTSSQLTTRIDQKVPKASEVGEKLTKRRQDSRRSKAIETFINILHFARIWTDLNILHVARIWRDFNILHVARIWTDLNILHVARSWTDLNILHIARSWTDVNILHIARIWTD
ncbi:hypothetical protein BaRGS_00040080 [Batillaria attramentaria]|uniref:Uncharacterized protein n=1 Tax=Batillaria attramentaria TaxID=370345 RepID=A0ABD0J1V6_9CAEN